MFAGFNLQLKDTDFLGDMFYEKGLQVYNEQKKNIEMNLKKYIVDDQYIDGSMMQSDWFPQIKADIFISHSHKDKDMVIAFSGWLYELFGLTSFIDSCVWGYSNDLLKLIDDKYCVKAREGEHTTYSYDKRNYSTSHVHMMLSMALSKMIDNTECLFFINTPESLLVSDSFKKNQTLSPWIFAEIEMSSMIRHKKLSEYRLQVIEKYALAEAQSLIVRYNVSIEHLEKLNGTDLLYWWKYGRKVIREYPLDCLYEYKGLLSLVINE